LDIREFSTKLAEATRDMTPAERQAIQKMFQGMSEQITKEDPAPASCASGCKDGYAGTADHGTAIPEGPTERILALKRQYMSWKPSITTHRAKAITKIYKENPGMPKILLRGKCFRYCCETAPLVIQENELIVGNPTGAPRAGAFAPDIAWRWMQDELDTIETRDQDPFYISPEDKKYMREVLFPFWEGKSVDEYCEGQYRECGGWELSGESFVSDCSYHALNGGGDSNPGYDVITMKKGMIDIQNEAREALNHLSYTNPEDIDRIYIYNRYDRRRYDLCPAPLRLCPPDGVKGDEPAAQGRA